MGWRETYRETLVYAVAIAGSERALAEHLKIPLQQIENWLNGVDTIPDQVFLAIVDVVIEAPPEAIARSRELLARRPPSHPRVV